MVLDSVKDKITKEYLRQSQIKNKIQTKANAHTGTLNICTCWIGYRQLERLPFALLDWIQTTGTLTICPVGLDTHQSKRPEPQPLERLPFARQ